MCSVWLDWASTPQNHTPATQHSTQGTVGPASRDRGGWLIIRSDSHPGAEAPEGAAALRRPVGGRRGWDVEAVAAGAGREVEVFSRVDPVGPVRAARSRLQHQVLALQRDETSAETKRPINQVTFIHKAFKGVSNNQTINRQTNWFMQSSRKQRCKKLQADPASKGRPYTEIDLDCRRQEERR